MSKRTQILTLFFITVFVVSVDATIEIQLEESNSDHAILKLEIPDFQFGETEVDGQIWQTISFPGCAYTCSEGEPKLPIQTTLIGIPPEAEIDIQLLASDYKIRKIAQIEPVKHISVGSDAMPNVTRNTQHKTRKLVELGFTGYIRNMRVAQIRFNPVQYNPETGTTKLYHNLRAKVVFVRTAASPSIGADKIVPESKTFNQLLKRNVLNYDLSKNWQVGKGVNGLFAPRLTHNTINDPNPAHSCKIYVDKDGIYKIDYDQLKYALQSTPIDEINPRTFKMYNKGKPVPIFVRGETDGKFDRNDEIIFFGVHNRGEYAYYDRYSVENVYWLYWTGKIGTRMIEHKVADGNMSSILRYRKYKYLTHIEENNVFMRLPQATDGIGEDYHYERFGYVVHRGKSMFLPPLPFDNWYWSLIRAPNLRSYSFELPDVAETSLSASVRVALRGRTENPNIKPDHHTQIWLNGKKLIEDTKWDGQESHLFESDEISQDYLVNGTNEITIICPGDTQVGEIDQVLLDWIELEYWRDYKAVDDFLEFSIPAMTESLPSDVAMVTISGFSTNNVEVYGTDGSKYTGIAVIEDDLSHGKYKVLFKIPASSVDANVQYIALAPDKFKRPKAVIEDEPSYLRSAVNGADYIIITHDDFISGVRELAEWRVTQNLRVAMVTVQNIYDEFNHGILNPYAIRDFLAYASENWRPPAPSFVTLIGDAKNLKPTPSDKDERDANPTSLEAFVPTTQVRSNQYGSTASDFQFSLLHGDDALPDIIVSRLPVNNMIQLADVIEKIISYEKHRTFGPWRKRFLFLGGTGEADFSTQSDNLIERYVPQPFEISRIYCDDPQSPYYGETTDVIDEMNSGNLLVSFIGHGGGGIWSDNRMMGLEDVDLLDNRESYPLVLSMTCFTGFFDNDYRQSLGEKMVIAEKKGAIGFLGATGLGWVYGDYWLGQELFDSLFAAVSNAPDLAGSGGSFYLAKRSPDPQQRQMTIGSIVTDAKINFLSKYPNYIDIANMFTLLGDSAQVFDFPQRSIAIQTPGTVVSNGILELNGEIEDSRLDNGNLEVVVSSTIASQNQTSEVSETSEVDRITTKLDGDKFHLQVPIPPASKSGAGTIIAYAWNEETDAIGATTYSVDIPHISNIHIDPPIKLNSQSYLYASAYGIGDLSLHTYWAHNPEEGWTKLPMNLVERDDNSYAQHMLYRTDQPLPTDIPSVVYYYLELTDGKGQTVKTPRKYYRVSAYPDLTFTDKEIKWIMDSSSVLLVEVKNIGAQPTNNIVVRFYDGSTDKNDQIGKDQVITVLKPDNYTVVQLEWEPKKEQHTIYVEIDPDEKIREQNDFNNVISKQFFGDKFVLTPQKGSNGVIQSLDGNLTFDLAEGKIQENAILEIKKIDPISLRQPDLKYVPLLEDRDGAVYEIRITHATQDVASLTQQTVNLSIKPDPSYISDLSRLKIYSYAPITAKWVLAGKNYDQNDKIRAEVAVVMQSYDNEPASSSTGLYALMESNDLSPPEVDISIEHQGFITGSYVSETPVISVALRDENGIDIRENSTCEIPERLVLLKDQSKVDKSEYSVSASPASSGLVLLAYSPTFSPGKHTLTVQAFDSSGNLGEDTIEFRVAGELEIEKIANYPNPVKQGTIFAYILTKEADKVSLKIYTGTGRLVKSFDHLDAFADYNEFFWDGLDDDGDELSNGVYFYKMIAEREDKVTKKVGKLVILR